MARLRLGTPYWLDASGTGPRPRPVLRHALDADIAIVGGGVSGCMVAYALAGAGARVVLLEANRVGRGSTAASTALLMQEPDTDFGALARRFGIGATRHIWQAGRTAVAQFLGTLRALHIDAGAHGLSSVYFTRQPAQVAELRREQRRRHEARLPARWLTATAVRNLTGISAEGGILTVGNAVVDPYKACRGLAAAAETRGALIFERTPVLRMRGNAGGVDIATAHGRVRASWGVVATGYATPAFKPLASRFRMVNTYVIATPAAAARGAGVAGLGDVMLWDTEEPYHYARWTPDHRLLFGGGDKPRQPGPRRPAVLRERTAALLRDLRSLYPSLANVDAAYAWEGLFAVSPTGLPYIGTHRHHPRQLFALGYGGNGMTFSVIAAGILQRIVEGTPRPEDAVFSFSRGRRG